MLYIILLFLFISTLKSILLSEFYNNFLIFSIYPLELSLILFNDNFTNTLIKWSLGGYFKKDNYIEENKDYIILIYWIIIISLFMLYILIKYRRKINKFIFISYLLKFLIINYQSLFLWSFNILINYSQINIFILNLLNIYIFNFITFWYPGILFYYIYGNKMYIYRKKYKFLINNYNPRFKYFIFILHLFKSMGFIYILLYKSNNILNYTLILVNIIIILIYYITKNIFEYYHLNNYLIILHLLNILLNISYLFESFYKYIFVIKYCILFFNFIFVIYFNYKERKINKIPYNELSYNEISYDNDNIEMETEF